MGRYAVVVFPVSGHMWIIFFSRILSFTCAEYFSCKSGGKMLYITSTALVASDKHTEITSINILNIQ